MNLVDSAGAGNRLARNIGHTYDVIVVGAGLAGYCAALEAARLGASVALLDREPQTGGATVLSGGSFAFAGTALQKSLGYDDSPALLFDDLMRVGNHKNDEALVRLYADEQLGAYEWLAALGATFDKVYIASGQSVPRGHSRSPREVLDIVIDHATRAGVQTSLSTRVTRLLRPDPEGAVTGVRIATPDGDRDIAARKGVVLATGGFSRNDALLELFAPAQAKAQRMGSDGNMGDGLIMAWKLGAAFRDMGYIKGTFGSHISAGPRDHFLSFGMYAGGIAVNLNAQRFTDESKSYKLIGDACLKQPDARAFQIYDQPVFERQRPGIPSMDFGHYLEAGRIIRADTLEALARKVGLDPSQLQRTVDEYNAGAACQQDPLFGRTHLCNGFGPLAQITQAPFYAYPCTTVVLATYCGLTVDVRMRVQDVFGATIPGLYAAGGVMGGFHGEAYMTGTANGKATIFGRVAGRDAAARGNAV